MAIHQFFTVNLKLMLVNNMKGEIEIVLLGDFNLDLATSMVEGKQRSKNLLNVTRFFHLKQIIDKTVYTRITEHSRK